MPVTVSLRMDEQMAESLKRKAQREYCSVAAVIRKAIAEQLKTAEGGKVDVGRVGQN